MIPDGTYVSTAVAGRDLVVGSQITLTFVSEPGEADTRVSVNAGCNTMGGQVAFDDDRLRSVSPMFSTLMACDEALMNQDSWVSGWLESDLGWSLDGGVLVLSGGGVELTLEHRADPAA